MKIVKMMLLKKSYAQQLLQLALALSLLRVHQDSYFGYGWSSRLASHNNNSTGEGLILETATMHEYPYSNRKAIIPIIEDLVHLNRYRQTNSYDIQTYLLNIQNQNEQSSSENTQQTGQINDTASGLLENNYQTGATNELDLFMNSEHFAESPSVVELNLADLRDYDELSFPYAGIPLKDELYASTPVGIVETMTAASTSFTSDLGGSLESSSLGDTDYERVIDWSDFYDITPNRAGMTQIDDALLSVTLRTDIKTEDEEHNSTSGFSSSVELTQEVIYNYSLKAALESSAVGLVM